MPLEKLATDTAFSAVKMVENFVKDVWNRMDAISEKPKPSEYLSAKAVKAIQGVQNAGKPE